MLLSSWLLATSDIHGLQVNLARSTCTIFGGFGGFFFILFFFNLVQRRHIFSRVIFNKVLATYEEAKRLVYFLCTLIYINEGVLIVFYRVSYQVSLKTKLFNNSNRFKNRQSRLFSSVWRNVTKRFYPFSFFM